MPRAQRALALALGRPHEQDAARAVALSRKRIIVSAGMMRSGSTWLYNAVRLLLQEAEQPVYGFWIGDYRRKNARHARYLIPKLIEPSRILADAAWRCYTCHRDLRDVAVSLVDLGKVSDEDHQLGWLQAARTGHDFWAQRANLDIAYADIVNSPSSVLADLAVDLELTIAPDTLSAIASTLASLDGAGATSDGLDPETLMYKKHRFDGRPRRYVDVLDPRTEELIVQAHGDWLRSHGYLESP